MDKRHVNLNGLRDSPSWREGGKSVIWVDEGAVHAHGGVVLACHVCRSGA